MEISSAWRTLGLLLAEFVLLLSLGACLLRLIYWHTLVVQNQARWLSDCRLLARQARLLRRQILAIEPSLIRLPMPPRLRRIWNLLRWSTRLLKRSKVACP